MVSHLACTSGCTLYHSQLTICKNFQYCVWVFPNDCEVSCIYLLVIVKVNDYRYGIVSWLIIYTIKKKSCVKITQVWSIDDKCTSIYDGQARYTSEVYVLLPCLLLSVFLFPFIRSSRHNILFLLTARCVTLSRNFNPWTQLVWW